LYINKLVVFNVVDYKLDNRNTKLGITGEASGH